MSEMHPVERPRERLYALGAAALRDEELLAIVIGSGYRGRSALQSARDLLARFPDGSLARLEAGMLRRLRGIGTARAAVLLASGELHRRWAEAAEQSPGLSEPRQVWEFLAEERRAVREHFVGFYLDARNRLLRRETISIGTLTASLVHPREVFGPAVALRAASVVVAHNHPSGEPGPSREDRETTRRLARSGRLLGIPLLDHVIVARERFFSFRARGWLK